MPEFIKISQLPPTSSLTGAELLETVQEGVSVRCPSSLFAILEIPNVFNETVTFFGGVRFRQRLVTTDYDIDHLDCEILADASDGPLTLTLPASVGSGQVFRIKKIDSSLNPISVVPQGEDLIDGQPILTLGTQWDGCSVSDSQMAYWDLIIGPLFSDVARTSIANVFSDLNTLTGIRLATQTLTDDYSPSTLDFEMLADATAAPFTIFLPASTGSGQYYRIKKVDDSTNVVSINANGSDTIDGSSVIGLNNQWNECAVIDAAPGYWDFIGQPDVPSIDNTLNLLAGDNDGNAVDSGILAANVVLKSAATRPVTLEDVIALLVDRELCS